MKVGVKLGCHKFCSQREHLRQKRKEEMMKCRGILLVIFFLAGLVELVFANHVEFWAVQNRTTEAGGNFNVAIWAMKKDAGDYILDDILSSIELFDPDGLKIQPTNTVFGSDITAHGRYDANNGRWYFDSAFWPQSYYKMEFGGPLKTGQYHLSFVDNLSIQYDEYYYFTSLRDLPIIHSDTICILQNSEGLVWKWKTPDTLIFQSDISTSVRAWIDIYNESNVWVGDIWIKVPTHMGWAFAPNSLLQQIPGQNNSYKIGLQVRTNDNNNRAYSNVVNIEETNSCGCDTNNDNKSGLEEAIHVLQIMAGVR